MAPRTLGGLLRPSGGPLRPAGDQTPVTKRRSDAETRQSQIEAVVRIGVEIVARAEEERLFQIEVEKGLQALMPHLNDETAQFLAAQAIYEASRRNPK